MSRIEAKIKLLNEAKAACEAVIEAKTAYINEKTTIANNRRKHRKEKDARKLARRLEASKDSKDAGENTTAAAYIAQEAKKAAGKDPAMAELDVAMSELDANAQYNAQANKHNAK